MNSLGDERVVLERAHKLTLMVYIPLVFIVVMMGSKFSWVVGEQDKYMDPTSLRDGWEGCLIQPSLVTLPLAETAAKTKADTTGYLSECIFEYPMCNTVNGTDCVFNGVLACTASAPSNDIVDPQLPMGQFGQGLTAIGLQGILFSIFGHLALMRALRHPSWLPATIALLCWGTFAVLTYYTVNPVLPVPNSTNSTMLIIMKYMRWETFTAMNNGHNHCEEAFNIIWGYLGCMIGILMCNAVAVGIAIRGQYVRVSNAAQRHIQEPLGKTFPVMFLCCVAMGFYALMVVGKLSANATTVYAIQHFDYPLSAAPTTIYAGNDKPITFWYGKWFYPFQNGSMDFATILFINSFMSIIRGYTVHSKSAFKMSAVTAFFFALTAYPPILGGINFYLHNNFDDYTSCYSYFLQGGAISPVFGYPDRIEAEMYCNAFRCTVAGEIGLWATMHLIIWASFHAYNENRDRDSIFGNSYKLTLEHDADDDDSHLAHSPLAKQQRY